MPKPFNSRKQAGWLNKNKPGVYLNKLLATPHVAGLPERSKKATRRKTR